jgi:hypothetical protein
MVALGLEFLTVMFVFTLPTAGVYRLEKNLAVLADNRMLFLITIVFWRMDEHHYGKLCRLMEGELSFCPRVAASMT